MRVGNGVDDTDGDDEDDSKSDTHEQRANSGVGRVVKNGDQPQTDSSHENDHVPPLRSLRVDGHEAIVYITVSSLRAGLLEERLEATDNIVAVVEVCVDDGRRVERKKDTIEEGVGCRKVEGRVSLIRSLIVEPVLIDDAGNLVAVTESIVRLVDVDGHVSCIPGIRVPDGEYDGEAEEHAQEVVDSGEERGDERLTGSYNDVPVESWEGVESQTCLCTGDGSEVYVIRRDPRDPTKKTRSGHEKKSGDPEHTRKSTRGTPQCSWGTRSTQTYREMRRGRNAFGTPSSRLQ